MAQTRIGIFGKHPAFGDFLGAGLSGGLRELLEAWLNRMLPELRALWAGAWEQNWDSAPVLRFWIGAGLSGGVGLRGVMIPSRDRTGRRFPLVVAQAGGPPPVLDAAQDFYRAALVALTRLLGTQSFDPRETAQDLQLPPAPGGASAGQALVVNLLDQLGHQHIQQRDAHQRGQQPPVGLEVAAQQR